MTFVFYRIKKFVSDEISFKKKLIATDDDNMLAGIIIVRLYGNEITALFYYYTRLVLIPLSFFFTGIQNSREFFFEKWAKLKIDDKAIKTKCVTTKKCKFFIGCYCCCSCTHSHISIHCKHQSRAFTVRSE